MAIDGGERTGIGSEPERETDEWLIDRIEHAVVGRPDRGGATQMANLDVEERRSDERIDHRLDGLHRQIREQDPLAGVRQRVVWIHVHDAQLACRHHRDGVHLRPKVTERLQQRGAIARVADDRRLDQDERPAANLLGQERDIRQLEHAAQRFARVGHGFDPFPPGLEDLRRPLDRPEQRPGIDLGDREQLELDRGDGADVPAATTEGPEQLGLGLAVRPDEPPVGRHHVRRDDAVAGEAERADHPAEATPERVAEHADVR